MEIPTNTPPTDSDVKNRILSGEVAQRIGEHPVLTETPDPVRSVNFILDPSALTLGLGNIERWFDKNYFQAQVKDKDVKIVLNLYLPTYTLNELDYQRKGPIVGSTRAQEALKFIDRILENDDGILEFNEDRITPVAADTEKPFSSLFLHNLFLEHRTQHFPQWGSCVKFQIRSPSPEELPSHGKYSLYEEINHFGEAPGINLEDELQIPLRLRHLVRSAVYLTKMKHNGPEGITGGMWKLVSEDTVTKVWASCFGVDCLNINEAELLLFHGKDLTRFDIKAEGADFFSDNDMYHINSPDSLHKKVDTTSYNYTNYKVFEKAKKHQNRPSIKTEIIKKPDNRASPLENTKDGSFAANSQAGVITEDFEMISFAPREQNTKLVTSKLFNREPQSSRKAKKKPTSTSAKSENVEKKTESLSSSLTEKRKQASGKRRLSKKKSSAATRSTSTTKLGSGSISGPFIQEDKKNEEAQVGISTSSGPDAQKPTRKKTATPRKKSSKKESYVKGSETVKTQEDVADS